MEISIYEAYDRMCKLENFTFIKPKTKNKGYVGNYLENLIGIKNSKNNTDFFDGEMKKILLIKSKSNSKYRIGDLLIKETCAISMFNYDDMIQFRRSKYYQKMRNTLFVPVFEDNYNCQILKPILINLEQNKEFESLLHIDYEFIRKNIKHDELKTINGEFIQLRRKGNKNNKTYAFYYKRNYLKTVLEMNDKNIYIIKC